MASRNPPKTAEILHPRPVLIVLDIEIVIDANSWGVRAGPFARNASPSAPVTTTAAGLSRAVFFYFYAKLRDERPARSRSLVWYERRYAEPLSLTEIHLRRASFYSVFGSFPELFMTSIHCKGDKNLRNGDLNWSILFNKQCPGKNPIKRQRCALTSRIWRPLHINCSINPSEVHPKRVCISYVLILDSKHPLNLFIDSEM